MQAMHLFAIVSEMLMKLYGAAVLGVAHKSNTTLFLVLFEVCCVPKRRKLYEKVG